jgi:hypothetical protein
MRRIKNRGKIERDRVVRWGRQKEKKEGNEKMGKSVARGRREKAGYKRIKKEVRSD